MSFKKENVDALVERVYREITHAPGRVINPVSFARGVKENNYRFCSQKIFQGLSSSI